MKRLHATPDADDMTGRRLSLLTAASALTSLAPPSGPAAPRPPITSRPTPPAAAAAGGGGGGQQQQQQAAGIGTRSDHPKKGPSEIKNNSTKRFPDLLREILDDESARGMIEWLPCGTSFVVNKPFDLASNILPKYFKSGQFESFVRKLNRWGFRRDSRGSRSGAFYHEYFVRDKPQLMVHMNNRRAVSNPRGHGPKHLEVNRFNQHMINAANASKAAGGRKNGHHPSIQPRLPPPLPATPTDGHHSPEFLKAYAASQAHTAKRLGLRRAQQAGLAHALEHELEHGGGDMPPTASPSPLAMAALRVTMGDPTAAAAASDATLAVAADLAAAEAELTLIRAAKAKLQAHAALSAHSHSSSSSSAPGINELGLFDRVSADAAAAASRSRSSSRSNPASAVAYAQLKAASSPTPVTDDAVQVAFLRHQRALLRTQESRAILQRIGLMQG